MRRILFAAALAVLTAGCGGSSDSGGSSGGGGTGECGTGSGSASSPRVLCTADDLNLVGNNPGWSYVMGGDIALSGEWTPAGTRAAPFTGTFDGAGHKITGLYVDKSGDYAGLFGYIEGGKITRLSVETASGGVNGTNYVGGIAGRLVNGSISECSANGTFSGRNYVGAIAGYVYAGEIRFSSSGGGVTGEGLVGGIAGRLRMNSVLTDSYSKAAVNGQNDIGGIAGEVNGSSVMYTYATGTVQTTNTTGTGAGGIAGSCITAEVSNNAALNIKVGGIHAVGHVTGSVTAGGNVVNNYALSVMAIWGQPDSDIFTPLSTADAALRTTYEGLGWRFGGNADAPWKEGTPYPQLYFE